MNLNHSASESSAVDFIDSNNVWDVNTNQDDAAYEAHYNTEKTYDYYYDKFNRNSIDDQGFQLIELYPLFIGV